MLQITPFVPRSSLDKQVAFYRDVLGFTVEFRDGNYAFLRRDRVALRLLEVECDIDLHAPEREQSFYIDVDDVDALYAELAPRLAPLPGGRVRAPFDQPYGQRELHVMDEDCCLVFFGQRIAKSG
jgi:catechol 2,3-dioxygenase-like lactoylglutathione lyase family enzyme